MVIRPHPQIIVDLLKPHSNCHTDLIHRFNFKSAAESTFITGLFAYPIIKG